MFDQVPEGKLWKCCLLLQFLTVCMITIKSVCGDIGGHYLIFTTAGNYLIHGKNPYGIDWGYGGLWFYSPLCGWFFGGLSLLPAKMGLAVFNLGSHIIFIEGFRRFLKKFPKIPKANWYLSILIVLATGELIGAYQSVKLEMAMIGGLLIVADLLTVRPIFSAGLAAVLINFKWFPLAPIGLLAISNLRQRKFKFSLSLAVALGICFVLPVVFYGWQFTEELYRTQNMSLDRFVSEVYNDFPSVFGLLKHTFNFPLQKSVVSVVMGTVAILLALLVFKAPYNESNRTITALSLGTLYIVNFNLLSQFNAYMIATPALAYGLFLCFVSTRWRQGLSIFAVAAYWVIVSMFFSDLVPRSFRDLCRELRFKPMGSLILLLVLAGFVCYDILQAKKQKNSF